MKTVIFFYTGTGNSLWTAKQLAALLGDSQLQSIASITDDVVHVESENIGVVFPVHMWGLPRRIIDFVNRLNPDRSKYYFALAVNAHQPADTLPQLQRLMSIHGLTLSAGYSIILPSNYIPWSDAAPAERIEELNRRAREKIVRAAEVIKRQDVQPIERGPLWQKVLFSKGMYTLAFPHISEMDKDFWVTEACNACRICEKICPAGNIDIREGKPIWLHHCEQCLACIQWCPRAAIQFGKSTIHRTRYHHPEVKLTEMLASPEF